MSISSFSSLLRRRTALPTWMVSHILLGKCCRESNTLCFYLCSSPVARSNYKEYGQAISNEHVVSGESINSSKIVSTVTWEALGEQINEGSCIWKPLLQATFSLAISHDPSQRSAAHRLFEADFKHPMKRPRAGSRIRVGTVERQLLPPWGSCFWTPGSCCFPQKASYCSEAQGTTRSNMPLGEAPSPGLPWGPSCRLHLKTEKNTTCHNALPKATHLWTMGPYYNSSVQAIKNMLLSSPFPRLKQDIKVWKLNKCSEWPRQDKQENFIYQGYFPHFQESHLLFWLVSGITGYMHPSQAWKGSQLCLLNVNRTNSILQPTFKILNKKKKQPVPFKKGRSAPQPGLREQSDFLFYYANLAII